MRPTSSRRRAASAPLTYALRWAATRRRRAPTARSRSTADGTYIYTLTAPFDTTPDADNGTNTEVAESFTYVVTDANGNTHDRHDHDQHHRRRADGDMPTSTAWSRARIVTGNVLTDGTADVFGADGATTTVPAGGVIGRCGGQRHLDAGDRRGRRAGIAGSFGTLTLNADGSYSYDGNPNVVPPAGATDMFVYTITDGDGDTSTMTLTINLTDCRARCAGRQRRDGERGGARHDGRRRRTLRPAR